MLTVRTAPWSVSVAPSNLYCFFRCLVQFAKYTCPRCNTQYCSLACYQSEVSGHNNPVLRSCIYGVYLGGVRWVCRALVFRSTYVRNRTLVFRSTRMGV